jgi:predicted nucleic acid-binding Zn ribbon protein
MGSGRPRNDEPVPIGAGLDRVLGYLRAPAARTVKTVFTEWAELAGPQLAAHAQPIALRDGELLIEVDDPAWVSQLRWLEPELRTRLEALPGAPRIDRIRFRSRPVETR